jgi:hypothetical protein
MKKIYLLSAAALFAFSANATNNIWYASGGATDNTTFTMEQVSGSLATNGPVAKVVVTNAGATGDPWAVQFCNILHEAARGQAEGNTIKIDFEVLHQGAATEGATLSFLVGKMQDETGTAMHDDWQWGDCLEITDVKQPDGSDMPNGCVNITYPVSSTEWTKIELEGTIGANGKDWIGIQINLGKNEANEGAFFFKNFNITMKKDVIKYFEDKAADNTAIAEEAAVKAYVANNVIFASEAADVVVYNINGVAVKSAKNVTSLNVADLKAGLYIAKVGNTTVKFVK